MSAVILLSLALTLAPAQAPGPACYAMTKPVAAGEVVDASNARPAPCAERTTERELRYDRHARVVRARVALGAGEPLGRVFLPARPPVMTGDRIAIAVRVGPVIVSREAVALQRAGAGQRFFVRSGDGTIFAAPPIAEGHAP